MPLDLDELWDALDVGSKPNDDEVLIFGDRREPPTEEEDLLDQMFSQSMRLSSPVLGPLLRKADKVFPYIWELMDLKVGQRRKAVRSLPYRDLLLADTLLDHGSTTKWLEGAEQMAELAEWIAEQPWPQDRERAAQIRARACIAQGDFRRLRRDWQGAELRFGAAFSALKELPVCHEHIVFCRRLSALREDQGRLHEAAELWWQAMLLDRRLLPGTLPFGDLIHLAYIYLKQNDPGRAMTLLTQLRLDKDETRCGYNADLALGRAVCLAAVGLAEPARRLTEESLPHRRLIWERDRRLPYEWLECRIAVHLGDLDRAIPRLEAIRRWLRTDSRLAEVCLCSIDLALAYTKKGDAGKRLPGLLKDLARLPSAAEHPWALGALWWFREAVEQGRAPEAAAREAAEIVHRREKLLARPAGPNERLLVR